MARSPTNLLLFLLLLVVATLSWPCDAKTPNRQIDGYEHSGNYGGKKLVWRGIRSSPGVLWFFFFFFAYAADISLALQMDSGGMLSVLSQIDRYPMHALEGLPGRQLRTDRGFFLNAAEFSERAVPFCLGIGLFFMGLAVSQLSDLLETYFVSLCSIQLLIDSRGSPRKTLSNIQSNAATLISFVVSTVVGIVMLDSFHALNKLNLAYVIFAYVLLGYLVFDQLIRIEEDESQGLPLRPVTKFGIVASCLHLAFPVAAFVVADSVEGSHRKPMLAFLCTTAVHSLLTYLFQYRAMSRENVTDSERSVQANELVNEINRVLGDRWASWMAAAAMEYRTSQRVNQLVDELKQVLGRRPRDESWADWIATSSAAATLHLGHTPSDNLAVAISEQEVHDP